MLMITIDLFDEEAMYRKSAEILRHLGYEFFLDGFTNTGNGRLLLALACDMMAEQDASYYAWRSRFVYWAVLLLDILRGDWWVDYHDSSPVVLAQSTLQPEYWPDPAQFAFHLTDEDFELIDSLTPPSADGRHWARIRLSDYFYDLMNQHCKEV